MKKYKVSFKTATEGMIKGVEPWNEIRNDDAIQDDEETAIEIALQYLRDTIDPATVKECELDDGSFEMTYYDENGKIIEHDYDFRAVEVA